MYINIFCLHHFVGVSSWCHRWHCRLLSFVSASFIFGIATWVSIFIVLVVLLLVLVSLVVLTSFSFFLVDLACLHFGIELLVWVGIFVMLVVWLLVFLYVLTLLFF